MFVRLIRAYHLFQLPQFKAGSHKHVSISRANIYIQTQNDILMGDGPLNFDGGWGSTISQNYCKGKKSPKGNREEKLPASGVY